MAINFLDYGKVELTNVRLVFRNFRGIGGEYNDEGNRNFNIVIPDQETADILMNDCSADGAGWAVRIKPPRNEDDDPFMHLPVKINYRYYDNGEPDIRNPKVYVEANGRVEEFFEDEIGRLDFINIAEANVIISPSDRIVRGQAYRTAYLDSIWVRQIVDKYAARYNEYKNVDREDDEY